MNLVVGDIWWMYMNKFFVGFNGLFIIEWDICYIMVIDWWVVVRVGLIYRLFKF